MYVNYDEKKTEEFAVDPFCGDCLQVYPTEVDQDATGGRAGISHQCVKYGLTIYHKDAHPKIYRCDTCLPDSKDQALINRMKLEIDNLRSENNLREIEISELKSKEAGKDIEVGAKG